jgi:hypothetical protein
MTAVLIRQLTFLLAERRKQYRPLVWRSVVPIRTGIPNWAEKLEVVKLTEQGNEPVPHQMGNQKAPVPSYDRSAGYLTLAEFALAYQVFQSELDRAQVTGINVSATKVLANQRSAEEFLDQCMSIGRAKYGITGILRSPDVTVTTLGTPWYSLQDDEILESISDAIFAVEDQSKQLHKANQLVMPDNAYRYLGKRTSGNSDRSLLSIAQEQNPGVRFVNWFRCRTAGGTLTDDVGSTQRMMALDSTADVVEAPMVHELQDSEPLKIHHGYEVLQTVKFGSPIIYQPAAIHYKDGDFSGTAV